MPRIGIATFGAATGGVTIPKYLRDHSSRQRQSQDKYQYIEGSIKFHRDVYHIVADFKVCADPCQSFSCFPIRDPCPWKEFSGGGLQQIPWGGNRQINPLMIPFVRTQRIVRIRQRTDYNEFGGRRDTRS